jgi:hypothetical protein
MATGRSSHRDARPQEVDEVEASGPTAVWSIAVLVLALTVDVWVYGDARKRHLHGHPTSVSIGSLRVQTPEAWFLACLLLWVVFVPLYLTATGRNPFTPSARR